MRTPLLFVTAVLAACGAGGNGANTGSPPAPPTYTVGSVSGPARSDRVPGS